MLKRLHFGRLPIGNIGIGPRLLGLIIVQALVLAGVGGLTLSILEHSIGTEKLFSRTITEDSRLVQLSDDFRQGFIDTVNAVNDGSITWAEARKRVELARKQFEGDWKRFYDALNADDREVINDTVTPNVPGVRGAFKSVIPVLASQDRPRLELYVSNDLKAEVGPFLDSLVATTALSQIESEHALALARAYGQRSLTLTVGSLVAGILLATLLGFLIYRSITGPVGRLAETVHRLAEGDLEARSELSGRDELGELGQAFDGMLDERVATLAKVQEENERLNNAVVELLQAVFQLSQRDLTVRVPVTEDVTGPIADSLNLLTIETAKVLRGVTDISNDVALASQAVKTQSDSAIAAATAGQQEVETTAAELATAAEQMVRIAKLAQACNEAAERAIQSTQTAHDTVQGTVGGITGIRDVIRETEKRIKRLGERSQEISGVVSLINSIAERTHILALNASMHAASAGEAGRGFAVVADEVQRLAENAREATSQIAGLVNNIQVETADTVTTMNEAITRVVEGSSLAERAGQQMEQTQKSTFELVTMVQQIAQRSRHQARSSTELRRRAQEIRNSSRAANDQLREQTSYTERLVAYSGNLLEAVSVFRLPEPTDAPAESTGDDEGRATVAIFPASRKAAAVSA